MTITAKCLLALLTAALIMFGWMFRYEATSVVTMTATITDRWTGEVHFCNLVECARIYPQKKSN